MYCQSNHYKNIILEFNRLKHRSFGNDKVHKICIARTNTTRTLSWNSTNLSTYHFVMAKAHKICIARTNTTRPLTVYVHVSASEMDFFPKGANNYNEIEFSLARIEVLNSKIIQNLSQLNANQCILFLIMYILHFNWFKSYIYDNTKTKTLRCNIAHHSYFLSF